MKFVYRVIVVVGWGVHEDSVSWVCPQPAPPGECLDFDDFPPQYETFPIPDAGDIVIPDHV